MHGVSFKDSNATFELKNYFGEGTCVMSFKFYYATYSQNIYPNKCEDVATLNHTLFRECPDVPAGDAGIQ